MRIATAGGIREKFFHSWVNRDPDYTRSRLPRLRFFRRLRFRNQKRNAGVMHSGHSMFFRAGCQEALIFAFLELAVDQTCEFEYPSSKKSQRRWLRHRTGLDGNRTASKLSTGGSAAGRPSIVGGGVGGSNVRV